MLTRPASFSLGLLFLLLCACRQEPVTTIDLSGEWAFSIDSLDCGEAESWYGQTLEGTIRLPGSMAENGLGEDVSVSTHWTGSMWNDSLWYTSDQYARYRQPGNVKPSFWLTPKKVYYGPAWYQKTVTIPEAWAGRAIDLRLERPHWETSLWVDDERIGTENYLATPHRYELTEVLSPGVHTLTIRVDNRIKDINPGVDAHSVTDNTQTNWNGIVGEIALTARPAVHLEHVRVRPNAAAKMASVEVVVAAPTTEPRRATVTLEARPLQTGSPTPAALERTITTTGNDTLRIEYALGEDAALWDEFEPNLYELEVSISSEDGTETRREVFGLRDFDVAGKGFTINGRPVFLRGTLECNIFPLTGYPPTDKAAWARIFRIIQAHGLNHMRFHSYCPPEAAFSAADEAGVYLQVEASTWGEIGDGKPIDEWIYKEADNIFRAYGNHPSFVLFAHGNEPSGQNKDAFLADFVAHGKRVEPDLAHAPGSGWPYNELADFYVHAGPRIQHWNENLKSIINAKPPQSQFDYRGFVDRYATPVVAHEIGQWCVYPNFKEMEKYTGVLEPRNFEIFQETLREADMGHLADSFLLASGKLQALCYKADIEAAQRTRPFGGFQLLDLHDFSGQGTALVGVLDAFWDEKGYISPEEFSRFCGPTTPLVRWPKRTYYNDETLSVPVEVSHFGRAPLMGITPSWSLVDIKNNEVAKGSLPQTDIALGNMIQLGTIEASLSQFNAATQLTLNVSVADNENSWAVWVYPRELPAVRDSEVHFTTALDQPTLRHLESGGAAILQLTRENLAAAAGGNIGLGFSPIFWNTSWTNGQQPHTLGILCNPAHPALAAFPTEYHSNWQWWELVHGGGSIILDELAPEAEPIVRVIDDWFENRRTALVFAVSVGKGKLIVSGADLSTDLDARPAARQLRYSLERYAASDKFSPPVKVTPRAIARLFNRGE